jgi:hypothetical protein
MPPRKQHHVWKAYLRAWATNEQLWVLQSQRVFQANMRDVAAERDFYRLNPLTDAEVRFIRTVFIEPLSLGSRRVNENFLIMFALPATLRVRMSKEEVAANPERVTELDEEILNGEERWHANMESRMAPYLEAARHGDISFYKEDKKVGSFLQFLATQHFRTKGIRERVSERFRKRENFDISRCWNVISHIMATALGAALYKERGQRALVLVRNETKYPFITGDQPMANLLGRSYQDESPAHLALYYPISPKLALFLDEPGHPYGLPNVVSSSEQVRTLNSEIIRRSHKQLFADRPGVLEELITEGQ